MFKIIIFTLGLAITIPCVAGEPLFLGSMSVSGQSFKFVVPEERVLSTPSWDGDFSKIPIPLDKATEIARASLQKRFSNKTFVLKILTLERFGAGNLKEKWSIQVMFDAVLSDGDLSPNFLDNTYVLLDGSLVESTLVTK